MKTELKSKLMAILSGAFIIFASARALAFIPPQPAVDECVDAIAWRYHIRERDLSQETVRARPTGSESAVIHLQAVRPGTESQRVRLYCTVDQNGSVTGLRANPRLLDSPR